MLPFRRIRRDTRIKHFSRIVISSEVEKSLLHCVDLRDARIGNRCLIALLFSCPMEVVSLGMTNGEALTP